MKLLAMLLSVVSFQAFALDVKQNVDDVQMAISVTDNVVEVQLEAPMDLVLGFSKKPESTLENKTWSDLQNTWFNTRYELFKLESYTCTEEETSIEYEIEEELAYGEVLAKVVLKCNKTVNKADITFNLKKKFPRVKNIKLTIFPNEAKTKTLTISKITEKITL